MSKTLADLEPGAWVCVVGQGTASMAHRHNIVVRVTKTMLVTRLSHSAESRERFRLDNGRSTPYESYSGTTAHIGCQRPKQVQR